MDLRLPIDSVLAYEANLDEQVYDIAGYRFHDLEQTFFGVEQQKLFQFCFAERESFLFNNILFNFEPQLEASRIILQPPVLAGFSRVFR